MKPPNMLLAVGVVLGVAVMVMGATGTAPASGPKTKEAPKPTSLHATLVKVDAKNLLAKARGKKGEAEKEITIPTDDKTEFLIDYEDGKLADLKPGMTLTVTPPEGTAALIRAHVKGLYGAVARVDGTKLVLKVKNKEVPVATDEKTKVFIEGKPAKLADLKAGAQVKVIPETGTAAKIAVVFVKGPKAKAPGAKSPDTPNADKTKLVDKGM